MSGWGTGRVAAAVVVDLGWRGIDAAEGEGMRGSLSRMGGSGAKSVKRGSWSSLVAKMDCREENWTVEDGRVVSFGSVGGDESICSLCLDDFFDFLDFFDGGVASASTSSFCFLTFFRDGSVEARTSPASCSGLMDPSSSMTSFFRRLLSLAIINREIFCGLIDRRSNHANGSATNT